MIAYQWQPDIILPSTLYMEGPKNHPNQTSCTHRLHYTERLATIYTTMTQLYVCVYYHHFQEAPVLVAANHEQKKKYFGRLTAEPLVAVRPHPLIYLPFFV